MLKFLKLGGSLITDKDLPDTPRLDVINRLADEIAQAMAAIPELKLVIGHGSGSFGHSAAKRHHTIDGVHDPEGWLGFADVWQHARALNQIMIELLAKAGIPVISFPPSACAISTNGVVASWDVNPIGQALHHGLVPIVQGDVIFDTSRGGTIVSTEQVFSYLAPILDPEWIGLAGLLEGVYGDYPTNQRLVPHLRQSQASDLSQFISGSSSIDVTGGMLEKVASMLSLTRTLHDLRISIFSGEVPGNVTSALIGQPVGTLLSE